MTEEVSPAEFALADAAPASPHRRRPSFATDATWSTIGIAIAAASTFIVTSVATRILRPAAAGEFFLMLAIINTVAVLGRFGFPQAVFRLVTEGRQSGSVATVARRVTTVTCCAALAAGVAYALLGGLIGRELFKSALLGRLAPVIALGIFCESVRVVMAETIRALGNVRMATAVGDALRGTLLVIGLVLLAVGSSTATVTAALVVAVVAGLVPLLASLVGIRSQLRSSHHAGRAEGPRVVRVALPLLVVSITFAAMNYADLWIVGALRGSTDTAKYAVAGKVAVLLSLPLAAVYSAAAPRIAGLVTAPRAQLEPLLRGAAALAAIPSTLAFLALALFGRPILGLIFGPFYRSAFPLVMMLAAGQLVNVLAGLCAVVLIFAGNERLVMILLVVSSLSTLLAEVILAKTFGTMGVAVAASLGLLLQNTLMLIATRRRLGIFPGALAWPRTIRISLSALFQHAA